MRWMGFWGCSGLARVVDLDDTPSEVQSIMMAGTLNAVLTVGSCGSMMTLLALVSPRNTRSAIKQRRQQHWLYALRPRAMCFWTRIRRDCQITITPLNGFHDKVILSCHLYPREFGNHRGTRRQTKADPPSQSFRPNRVRFRDVTGTSGDITQTFTFTLAVSAATGGSGTGTQVDLSPAFNLNGIYDDGTSYTTRGLDGVGYSYSANLLGHREFSIISCLTSGPPVNSTRSAAMGDH